MSDPIERQGAWWQQQADGSWLRWNPDAGTWEPQAAPPPPPPRPADTGSPTMPQTWATPRSGGSFLDRFRDRRVLFAGVGGAVVIAILLAAFAFAGGDEDPTAPPVSADPAGVAAAGSTDAKQGFIVKADALCAKALRRQLRLQPALTGDQLVSGLEKSRVIARDLMQGLRALKRPNEDRRTLRRLFAFGDRAVAMHDDLIAAARASDLAAIQSLVAEAGRIERKSTVLALKYGFNDCSKTVDDL